MRGSMLTTGAAIAILAVAGPARAERRAPPRPLHVRSPGEEARAQLAYTTREETCPDASAFRELVAAQLGYDPFVDESDVHVAVDIARDNAALVASTEVAEVTRRATPAGEEHRFTAPSGKCERLADVAAMSVAITLARADAPAPRSLRARLLVAAARPMLVAGVQETEPLPLPPPPPPPGWRNLDASFGLGPGTMDDERSKPRRPKPPPVLPEREPEKLPPFDVLMAVGPVVSRGVGPAPTIGVDTAIFLRHGFFTFEVAARIETTTSSNTSTPYPLDATVYSGAIIPCLDVAGLSGCVLARVGLFAFNAPTDPAADSSLFGLLGLRGAYTLRIDDRFGVRGAIEGALRPDRTSVLGLQPYSSSTYPVWTPPLLSAGISIAFVARAK